MGDTRCLQKVSRTMVFLSHNVRSNSNYLNSTVSSSDIFKRWNGRWRNPSRDPLHRWLLVRATSKDSQLSSPAELLYNRRVVSDLPIAVSGLRCAIRGRLDERQACAKRSSRSRIATKNFTQSDRRHTQSDGSHIWQPSLGYPSSVRWQHF